MNTRFRIFLLSLTLAFCTARFVQAQTLRLAGSDLFQGTLSQNLQNINKANDLTLDLDLKGSRLGLIKLQEGKADLGLLVFGAEDRRPEAAEFASHVIGYLSAQIVVPQNLSLSQLSYEQLAAIFGASEQANYRRWSEVGALGEWAPRTVSAMALSRRTSLAVDLFRYNVLKTPDFKPTVALLEDKNTLYARLKGEEGGIAILPEPPPADSGLKVLLIAKKATDVAYGPSSENLHTGDYPLRVPVYLVFRRGDFVKYSRFIRYLLAEETIPTLLAAGVSPLPIQARNQLLFDLEAGK